MENQLTTQDSQLAATAPQEVSIAQVLMSAISSGVTAENASAVKTLAEVYERMEAKNAEKSFNRAFVALQSSLPVIVATSVIPNRGKYERFEDVMRQIGPAVQANGFSVSFSMEVLENRIVETCHLMHVDGHSKSNSFAVRVGGKADSETQADCKAATTAKRNALLNALNIVIRQDVFQDEEDASLEGDVITADQANYLKKGVEATGSDVYKFLSYAGSTTFEGIRANRYEELATFLAKKAKGK